MLLPFMLEPEQVPGWAMDHLREAVGSAIGNGAAPPATPQQYQYLPTWLANLDPAMSTLPALTTPLAHAVFRCLLRLATTTAYGEDGKGDGVGAVWALGSRAMGAQVEVEAPSGPALFFAYVELAALKAVALDVLLALTPPDNGVVPPDELARRKAAAAPHVRHIVDDIVTLKCPRCKTAFIDFSGCCSLYCGCKCSFCAHWYASVCVIVVLCLKSLCSRETSRVPV